MMLQSLDIRDRVQRFSKHARCFLGSEAVEWMLSQQIATDVQHAVRIGNTLITANVIHHVTREHAFKNEPLFYRFTAHRTLELYRASSSLQITEAERVLLAAMKGTASSGTSPSSSPASTVTAATAPPSPKGLPVASAAASKAGARGGSGSSGVSGGLEIKDRAWGLRVYPKCFVGKEAVAWMIRERVAVNEVCMALRCTECVHNCCAAHQQCNATLVSPLCVLTYNGVCCGVRCAVCRVTPFESAIA